MAKKKKKRAPAVLQEPETELCLIGSMLIVPESIPYILGHVTEEDFNLDKTREAFRAITDLHKEGQDVDIATVKPRLNNKKCSYDQLVSMHQGTPNAGAYKSYVHNVERTRLFNELYAWTDEVRDGVKTGVGVDKVKAMFHDMSSIIATSVNGKADQAEVARDLFDSMSKHGSDMTWGMKSLDNLFGGIRRGLLYTLGAKTSHGKTTTALSICAANLTNGKKVIINSFENTDMVWAKLHAIVDRVPLEKLTKPWLLEDDEREQVREKYLAFIAKYNDQVVVMDGCHVGEILETAQTFKPDLVLLDYIQDYAQRIEGSSGLQPRSMVSKTMSDFKHMALVTNAACLCTSQFSRRKDEFFYRKPRLADLKEAGEIENASDGVICVWWRYKDYADKPEEQRKYQEDQYTLCVLKNRHGASDLDYDMVIDLESLRVYEEEVE